jgi:ubiquinone biosynthesis protein COQ4
MTEPVSPTFPLRTRPLAALAAVQRLMADKEATHEVFRIFDALDGPVTERLYQRFAATEVGARVLAERLDLEATLADRAALAALPAGSLGRAYLAFVSAEGLSVEGLQAEMNAGGEAFKHVDEGRRRFYQRITHSHDLHHVLTGYGRDFVGELALLAFSRALTRSRGLLLVMMFGLQKMKREHPALPTFACMREGGRLGRAAGEVIEADWEGLLPLPLAEVRRRLGVGAPARYLAIREQAEEADREYRAELAAQRVAG